MILLPSRSLYLRRDDTELLSVVIPPTESEFIYLPSSSPYLFITVVYFTTG